MNAKRGPVATAGTENWAYMPKFVMPGVYQLADTAYANAHRFMPMGARRSATCRPPRGDLETIRRRRRQRRCRGFYALDITDPKNPKGLWNLFRFDAVARRSHHEPQRRRSGLHLRQPVIGSARFDGKMVVVLTPASTTSPPGRGVGFFYVLERGSPDRMLDKVSTGVGTTVTPSA